MSKRVEEQTLRKRRVLAFGLVLLAAAVSGHVGFSVGELQTTLEQQSTSQIDSLQAVSAAVEIDRKIGPSILTDSVPAKPIRSRQPTLSEVPGKTIGNESQTTLNTVELVAVKDVTHYRDVQQTLTAFTTLPAGSLHAYLDSFGADIDKEGYAPTIFRAAYERLAEIDFDATLDEVLVKIHSSQSGSNYWNNLALSVLAEQQPEYVASSISVVSGVFKDPATERALYQLALSLDPETVTREALREAQLTSGDNRRSELLDTALSTWILKDPQSALAFVQTELGDDIEAQMITLDLLTHWLEHDPVTAASTVESVLNTELATNPDLYLDLADVYVSQRATTDPEGALQWLQAQDSTHLQNTVMDSVLLPWLDQDQTAAMSYLSRLDEHTAAELVPLALPVVADSLEGSSAALQGAIDWSNQLPQNLQRTAQQQLVGAWIRNHPQQGVDWLIQQSYGGQFQDLILPAAQALAREDAAAAARLHASLSGEVQLALTDSVIMSLFKHGEDRTLAWLNSQTDQLVIERGRSLVNDLF